METNLEFRALWMGLSAADTLCSLVTSCPGLAFVTVTPTPQLSNLLGTSDEVLRGYSHPLCQGLPSVQCCPLSYFIKLYTLIWTECPERFFKHGFSDLHGQGSRSGREGRRALPACLPARATSPLYPCRRRRQFFKRPEGKVAYSTVEVLFGFLLILVLASPSCCFCAKHRKQVGFAEKV